MENVRILFVDKKAFYDELKAFARANGLSISDVIRLALRDFLAEHK